MKNCSDRYSEIRKHIFKIIAFDWDGTAVENRTVDARPIANVLEELLKFGVYIVVITGTNFGNIDRQFSSLIKGPHKQNLFICTDRGSQVHGFDEKSNPVLIYNRVATEEENKLLSKVAEAVEREIEQKTGIDIEIVYDRLNRRKIDLIPEWPDPPKSKIGELLVKTEDRLKSHGFEEGIKGAFNLAHRYSKEFGLHDARITSDVKHVEVGLTDKSDSMKWVIEELSKKKNIPFEDTLVLGDEFGPVAGFDGSDFLMYLPDAPGMHYISVGKEPNGVPEGVHHVGGGPDCFMELMKEQVKLHKKLALTEDETFVLREEGYDPYREREIESLYTVGNGYLGTRGSLEEQEDVSLPATLVAGVFDKAFENDIEELAIAPDWVYTRIYVDGKPLRMNDFNIVEHRRILDMRKGIFMREWRHRGAEGKITSVKFLRFASLDDPHLLGMKIVVIPENYSAEIRVETGIEVNRKAGIALEPVEKRIISNNSAVLIATKTKFTDVTVAQAQTTRVASGVVKQFYRPFVEENGVTEDWSWQAEAGQTLEIEKFVSIYTSRESSDPIKEASKKIFDYKKIGFDELLIKHIEEWDRRWSTAAVSIEGDKDAQLWINFAAYHLIIAGNHRDERVSISARTLTGTIYKGHVFWDTEMFMLPFFIYTHPQTARALLMYRYHTLPGARKEAQALGLKGALYAWESTTTGEEMTPEFVIAPNGEVILILSGKMEQHINSAVAYGVWHYWVATKDVEFFRKAGAEIIIETARFWVGRAEKRDGIYHIYNIEGPDEYHEIINDSIYTNATAVWNIKRAFEAVDYLKKNYPSDWERIKQSTGLDENEFVEWNDVAHNMYLNGIKSINSNASNEVINQNNSEKVNADANAHDGLIEQFDGYFKLNDINVYDYEPRTAPLDAIIGREETANSQLVKQADVVLLLYILENEFSEEIVRKNYEYYETRTAHGSSLSPSTYGLVAARLGMMQLADRYLRQAGQIDLANNMGNAAGGVHAAALGGLWQQIIMGFGGVRVTEEGLYLYPRLLEKWKRLKFTLLWRGNRLDFNIQNNKAIELRISGNQKTNVGIYRKTLQELLPGREYISRWDGNAWLLFEEIE